MRIPSGIWGLLEGLGTTAGCIDDRNISERFSNPGPHPSASSSSGTTSSSNASSSNASYFESKREGFLRIINSDAYAEKLTVFLEPKRGMEVFQEFLSKHPGVEIKKSEHAGGEKIFDWNRVYHIEVPDQNHAAQVIEELMQTDGVSLVYPKQKEYGPHAEGAPNLEGLQTYLEGPERAGLNIRHAWDQGVYGAGAFLSIHDGGLNFEHEEFEMSEEYPTRGGNDWGEVCDTGVAGERMDCSFSNVAHGTATLGIVHARHGDDNDRHGIRGIAPQAWPAVGGWDFNAMPKGSIVLEECATQFSWDGRVTCQEGHSGLACVPCDSNPESYAFALNLDEIWEMVFITTAGNGAINLDEVALIDDETMERLCGGPREDPAAAECWAGDDVLMIGASAGDRGMVQTAEGLRPVKREFSNCGERVKAFGWGERVVTTAWRTEDGPILGYGWDQVPNGPNPDNNDSNRYYTNQFGGTSAAAAMVAGAAVLVQSYFKDISGGNPPFEGSRLLTRYLTPKKMKEILYQSGIDAVAEDGCGIGRQPRTDEAFRLTREFWENEVLPLFPELVEGRLESRERLEELRELGMGLGRGDRSNPELPFNIPCDRDDQDFRCIEGDLIPHLSKKMDFDEDGRGDLVSWEPGMWRIDLSSVPPLDADPAQQPNDNYGAWDVTLNYPSVSHWEVPVVEDYDSDGQADLAIYDRENGRWNIAITNDETLMGQWHGWDHVVNWPARGDSQRWEDEFYTRPLSADYNGDQWMDLAVQTSDGHWKINFGWRDQAGWEAVGRRFVEYGPLIPDYQENEVGRWTSPGVWDLAYLTQEELQEYPGWSYLPLIGKGQQYSFLVWRGPDGETKTQDASGEVKFTYSDFGYPLLGGTENSPIYGKFADRADGISAKTPNGSLIYFYGLNELQGPEQNGTFGSTDCKPLSLMLDNDSFDDFLVMCPNEWRILYSGDLFSDQLSPDHIRYVSLEYDNPFALPGHPVFGGLPYQRIVQVRDYLRDLGTRETPSIFDYSMNLYEYCDLPWLIEEMPVECF